MESMPRGGTITVRTGVLAEPTSRPKFETERVFIEVSDTGVGMDEKTRERCLEPFFSTKEKNGARGLGLSKVYGIVQRHDAEIQMDSVRGEGTTVRLVFASAPAGNTERFYANPSAALPPLRILCIDDEPSILDVLRMVLRSGGHQVETADDGQLGLEKFRAARVRNEPFDVVLTDLGMPHLDGQQVARTIKQESFKTPVIMLTGWGGIMQAEGTHPRDVDIVLAKPPQVSELIGAIQKVTAAAA
jgi:CheY-like chemotaxis protein